MSYIAQTGQIRIGFLSTIYHSSFIIMCLKQIETELNLEPNWELHGTGPSIIQKFLENDLDIGYIGLPPTIIGIDKGASIKCVAGGHVEGTLMVAYDHYQSYNNQYDIAAILKQFENKTIGVPKQGSIHDVILRNFVRQAGLETKIDIRNYDITDFILLDMEDGLVDAAVGTPALAAFLAQYLNTKIIIPPQVMWPFNPSYGIVVHESVIQEKPDLVEEFLLLHKKACAKLRENPEEVARLVKNETELLPEKFILNTIKISPKYCAALPQEYIQSTMRFVATLQDLNYIRRNLSVSDIFELTFIKKIHIEPHHYHIDQH
ncbi:MAG: ABC transporter substrate-binding protein [Candidatus Helarchaeota archaeon]